MLLTKTTEIFVRVDDFCLEFEKEFKRLSLEQGEKSRTRQRKAGLCESEVITILILFQGSGYRNFKAFYTGLVMRGMRDCFPGVVSYNRFIELSHRCGIPFMLFIHHCCRGKCTGISFIDSTVLRVCHAKRAKRNRVFRDVAHSGKSTMGWFFGFKLHLIINDKGEVLSFYLTKGNVDDRDLKVITRMTEEIFGRLFGDKGYISKALSDILFGDGIQLVTHVRRNMKQAALSNEERVLLRKRSVIETVNDQLKNICHAEHTRHRSISGFLLNLMGALAAYSFFEKKPSITPIVKETKPAEIYANESQLLLAA
jgi:hypothetical protein